MNTLPTTIDLVDYVRSMTSLIIDDIGWAMFVDTNILTWSFRLNSRARNELFSWLGRLALHERLYFPAWVVHEYNQLIQRGDEIFSPQKKPGKAAVQNLLEIEKYAALLVDDEILKGSEYINRNHFLKELTDASKKLQKAIKQLNRDEGSNRRTRLHEIEKLIENHILPSDIHNIVANIENEAKARYSHRIAPGFRDDTKDDNAYGDLIIWKEIIGACKENQISRAIILTNDTKRDWLIKPQYVSVNNKRIMPGSSLEAEDVFLPNPTLVHEFQQHTGSSKLTIISMDLLTQILGSPQLNTNDHADFINLAAAVKTDLDVTSTLDLIQWFLDNESVRQAASASVCRWDSSPDEVDMKKFRDWTAEHCKHIDLDKVNWITVFCELFL